MLQWVGPLDWKRVKSARRCIATWGSQSWLQPPFKPASRSTTEMDLVLESRDFTHQQEALPADEPPPPASTSRAKMESSLRYPAQSLMPAGLKLTPSWMEARWLVSLPLGQYTVRAEKGAEFRG